MSREILHSLDRPELTSPASSLGRKRVSGPSPTNNGRGPASPPAPPLWVSGRDQGPDPTPAVRNTRAACKRSGRSASMAAALLARAGGPLRRGECARTASAEPQGRSHGGSCCVRGPPSGQHLPAARGLCPSSVASCTCRARALQGPRLLLGSLPVGPSSPAPLCAAAFTSLPLSQFRSRFWVSWSCFQALHRTPTCDLGREDQRLVVPV